AKPSHSAKALGALPMLPRALYTATVCGSSSAEVVGRYPYLVGTPCRSPSSGSRGGFQEVGPSYRVRRSPGHFVLAANQLWRRSRPGSDLTGRANDLAAPARQTGPAQDGEL